MLGVTDFEPIKHALNDIYCRQVFEADSCKRISSLEKQ